MDEEALTGGNSTVVVRVGHTVRRIAGPWTASVQCLLSTLRDAGITEVPEHLGLDEQGREMLSFLPGEVPNYPLPAWIWNPSILDQAGALLKRIHDASVPMLATPSDWQLPAHQPVEAICHNDVAPYNMVFRDHRLVGLIDFDTASPGPRIWDLAYLAYRLVPLTGEPDADAPPPSDRAGRLNRLIAAYGADFAPSDVLAMACVRLDDLARYTDGRAAETGRADFLDHAGLYRRDRSLLLAQLDGST